MSSWQNVCWPSSSAGGVARIKVIQLIQTPLSLQQHSQDDSIHNTFDLNLRMKTMFVICKSDQCKVLYWIQIVHWLAGHCVHNLLCSILDVRCPIPSHCYASQWVILYVSPLARPTVMPNVRPTVMPNFCVSLPMLCDLCDSVRDPLGQGRCHCGWAPSPPSCMLSTILPHTNGDHHLHHHQCQAACSQPLANSKDLGTNSFFWAIGIISFLCLHKRITWNFIGLSFTVAQC